MSKFYIVRTAFFVFALCATTAISSPAQTLTTLASFKGRDGKTSGGTLIRATDGNFYGTTQTGGANGLGSVFRVKSVMT